MRVIVVGAGAIGLAVAAELGESGAEVTVLDQAMPGSGTTGQSFAWVNSNGKSPQSYFELNSIGLRAFHRRQRELVGAFFPSGHLEFATEPHAADRLESRIGWLAGAGYRAELIGVTRARGHEPELAIPNSVMAIGWFADEGFCDTDRLVAGLCRRAAASGVRFCTHARVADIATSRGRVEVVLDSRARLTADRVVLCVGRWSGALTRLADHPVPMVDAEAAGSVAVGLLAITRPIRTALRGVVSAPGLNLRPHGTDRLMLQAVDLDERADATDACGAVSEEIRRRARELLPLDPQLRVGSLVVGRRALPADGLTVAGWLDSACRTYVVITHSGITLSLLLGGLVSAEVIEGDERPELSEFRPTRFPHGLSSASGC